MFFYWLENENSISYYDAGLFYAVLFNLQGIGGIRRKKNIRTLDR